MNKKLYQIKVNGENVDKYVDPEKEKSFLQKYPQAKFLSEFYQRVSKQVKTNFKETFLMLLPLGIISIALFFLVGNYFDTIIINKNIIPIILLYPIWGVIQQFIVVALVAGNLRDMESLNIPNWAIVLLTSLVFAVVHFPFVTLVGGTFLLALVYTSIYLKKKNLYVLGLYHGWLGAFYFYTIVGRDPWAEVFGVLGF